MNVLMATYPLYSWSRIID